MWRVESPWGAGWWAWLGSGRQPAPGWPGRSKTRVRQGRRSSPALRPHGSVLVSRIAPVKRWLATTRLLRLLESRDGQADPLDVPARAQAAEERPRFLQSLPRQF